MLPDTWSVWDYIEVKDILSFKNLQKYFLNKFSIILIQIQVNGKLLYEFPKQIK